jgi:hypothetical protein
LEPDLAEESLPDSLRGRREVDERVVVGQVFQDVNGDEALRRKRERVERELAAFGL